MIAYVTLDGADTALVNLVLGLDLSDIGAAAAALSASPGSGPSTSRNRRAGSPTRVRAGLT